MNDSSPLPGAVTPMELEAGFRAVFEQGPLAVAILDGEGRLLRFNERFRALLGFAQEELLGRTTFDITHPDDVAQERAQFSQLVAEEGARQVIEKRYVRKDGSCVWVEVVRGRVEDERPYFLSMVEDVTARKGVERELREKHEDLTRAQAIGRLGSWRIDVATGQLRWSDQTYEIFGMRRTKRPVTYDDFLQAVHPEDRAQVDLAWQRALRGAPYDVVHRIVVGGEVKWVRERAELEVDGNGQVHGGFGTVQDITDVKRTEGKLRAARAFADKVMQSVGNAVVVIDSAGIITQANTAAEQLTGYATAELEGRHFLEFVSGSARAEAMERFRSVAERAQVVKDFEVAVTRKDGATRHLIVNAVPLQPNGVRWVVASGQDITVRKEMEEAMRRVAQHDHLTGLPNRYLFREILGLALRQASRAGQRLALMYVDLDRFKEINDTYGHEAGDLLLLQAAERLRRAVRGTDTVSRVGGDEFNVALPGIHQGRAAEVACDVIAGFAEPFRLKGGLKVNVTSSVGISIYPDDGLDPEALIGQADRAMYAAKADGRNTFRFFNPGMDAEARRRARAESELRHSLARGQLELYYQPQRRIGTGEIVAVEALLRWNHPERGILPAAEFLPLVEESALAVPLNRWVLDTACRQLAAWRRAGASARVSVNLSRKQFRQSDLMHSAGEALEQAGLAPGSLDLEVSEETVMEDPGQSAERLRLLEERGIRVTVDHFGTGRSSVDWLQRLPIGRLKMDKRFVHEIGLSERSAVVQAVIDLSHRLGIPVVAGGVETDAQWDFLARHGCDEAQGEFVGAPLPAHALEPLLV